MDSEYVITSNGTFVSVDELYHHGIKGMKWGIRRYQNADGTLTAAGKKRRQENEVSSMSTDELRRKVNRLNNEQRYIGLTKSSSPVSKVSDGIDQASKVGGDVNKIYKSTKGDKDPYGKLAGQGIDAVSRTSRLAKKVDNIVRTKKDAKAALKKLEGMSDKDLAATVERLDLERQYSRLRDSDVRRGKVRVGEVLDIAGDVVGIAASAVTIAVGIKKLMNK